MGLRTSGFGHTPLPGSFQRVDVIHAAAQVMLVLARELFGGRVGPRYRTHEPDPMGVGVDAPLGETDVVMTSVQDADIG